MDATLYENVERIVDPRATSDVTKTNYENWADSYEQDCQALHYNPHRIAADVIDELFTDKHAKIIDLAAGTGLVGVELRNHGFMNMDAMDGCGEMLKKATEKGIYQRLFVDYLGPNRMQVDDDIYDISVTAGSFVGGHVNQSCFPEIIRITKPGGHFVLVMREEFLETVDDFRYKLEPEMQRLENEQQWQQIMRKVVPEYYAHKNGLVYVFKILKKNNRKNVKLFTSSSASSDSN